MTRFVNVVVVGLTLALAAGCKKGPSMTTNIPRNNLMGPPVDAGSVPAIASNESAKPDASDAGSTGIAPVGPDAFKDYIPHPEILAANTVHFAFDSAAIKASEKANVQAVADYMKAHAEDAVEIDGHCDERGTAEYNRSLGDHRAITLREELAKLGADPNHVKTISYGFDRPVESGHDEAAWAKNRRGEFIVLTPPKLDLASKQN